MSQDVDRKPESDQAHEQPIELILPNMLAVVTYLKQQGWKISKSPAYEHQKQGKIRPQPDGTYRIKDVEIYARRFLKRLDGSGSPKKVDTLQEEKLAAEIKKAKAQAEHWDLKAKIQSGLYIPRSDFERELATRAAIFRTDLENFFRSQAGEMIHLVNGDSLRAPELIDFMLKNMEIWLGRYSENKTFMVADGTEHHA